MFGDLDDEEFELSSKSTLFYGDNLEILRAHIPDESIDLVYLDPPFNSNRDYNVIFARGARYESNDAAQIEAFGDTWVWTPATDQQFADLVSGGLPLAVSDALSAMHLLIGENDAMAYLVNMTPRLVELHRVLKDSGSLYLHCDPTMSHYLKLILDAIFGPPCFRNEVIWKRTGAHNSARRWGPQHDVILFYTKSRTYTWNRTYQDYDAEYIDSKFTASDDRGPFQPVSLTGPGVRTGDSGAPWRGVDPTSRGRHWQPPSLMYDLYEELSGESLAKVPSMQERLDKLDEQGLVYWPAKADGLPRFKQYVHISRGLALQDIITDIHAVNAVAAERLGYPTQKPVALMERILAASSNEGDVVLDPFCGCGTTIDAAIRLNRKWIGIDITYISIDLIEKRLRHTHGPDIRETYKIRGIPRDMAGAYALFSESAFDFERWAVSLVNAQPNEKQVKDKGIDGVARFPLDSKGKTKGQFGRILVSVKGGKNVGPQFVRDLVGTVETQKADMGLLVLMGAPTKGMIDAVNHAGTYVLPANGQHFPRVQIVTVPDLLQGRRPKMPPTLLPYIQAPKKKQASDGETLF